MSGTKPGGSRVEGGSQDTLLSFVARERGTTEELFLQDLAKALNWPYVDLPKTEVPPETRKKISTKIAFQYPCCRSNSKRAS